MPIDKTHLLRLIDELIRVVGAVRLAGVGTPEFGQLMSEYATVRRDAIAGILAFTMLPDERGRCLDYVEGHKQARTKTPAKQGRNPMFLSSDMGKEPSAWTTCRSSVSVA